MAGAERCDGLVNLQAVVEFPSLPFPPAASQRNSACNTFVSTSAHEASDGGFISPSENNDMGDLNSDRRVA